MNDGILPDCPGPVLQPRRPGFVAPPGACDCHFHVFGPYDRFPLASGRSYTPPAAPVSAYRRVMATLGLERSVIVQPSVYGTDNGCTIEAAGQLGGAARCRIVAVIDRDTGSAALRRLQAAGACGVRVNAVAGGGPLADQIGAVAALVAPLGWHVQLYLPQAALAEAAPALRALPTDVVIDHMGALDPAEGLAAPGVQALLRLLDSGRAWVKLSGYLSSTGTAPWADVAPFAQAFANVRPDRVIWGTNWPHPIRFRDMPDDGDLLDALAAWLPDDAVLRRVLVDNPARLYGFDG